MKKIFLSVAAFVLISAGAFAQIEQGTILVGASSNLSFISQSFDGVDDKWNNFNLDVMGGYFVIENLAVGLNLGFDNTTFGDSKSTVTGFGLFGRYYVNGKIFIGAGFNSNKQKDDDGLSESEFSFTTIPLEVGYAAFITDNIAIEPSLNYILESGDVEGSIFGLNVGFALYLGR